MATFKHKTKLELSLVLEIKFSDNLLQALLKMINKIIRNQVDKNDGRVTIVGKVLSFLLFFGLTYAKSM